MDEKKSKEIDDVFIGYLFYLIEGMGNECLAFSKCV